MKASSGVHSVSYNSYRGALSPGVNLLGHKADCSPPPSAKVLHEWSHNSSSPYAFMIDTEAPLPFTDFR